MSQWLDDVIIVVAEYCPTLWILTGLRLNRQWYAALRHTTCLWKRPETIDTIEHARRVTTAAHTYVVEQYWRLQHATTFSWTLAHDSEQSDHQYVRLRFQAGFSTLMQFMRQLTHVTLHHVPGLLIETFCELPRLSYLSVHTLDTGLCTLLPLREDEDDYMQLYDDLSLPLTELHLSSVQCACECPKWALNAAADTLHALRIGLDEEVIHAISGMYELRRLHVDIEWNLPVDEDGDDDNMGQGNEDLWRALETEPCPSVHLTQLTMGMWGLEFWPAFSVEWQEWRTLTLWVPHVRQLKLELFRSQYGMGAQPQEDEHLDLDTLLDTVAQTFPQLTDLCIDDRHRVIHSSCQLDVGMVRSLRPISATLRILDLPSIRCSWPACDEALRQLPALEHLHCTLDCESMDGADCYSFEEMMRTPRAQAMRSCGKCLRWVPV